MVPSKAVVIYHDHCVDGFGAAWAFHKLVAADYAGGVDYIPAVYDKLPSFEKIDKLSDLYILDFSFGRTIIEMLALNSASVTVLDHHKTAAETLQNWEHGYRNLEIMFDMDRSGAGISWDYFSDARQPRPPLIDYIEDRDLWKFKLPRSREINALIGFTKKEFPAYNSLDLLLDTHFRKSVEQGELLLESHQRHCESVIAATKRPFVISGQRGLICNCPGQFASDVGSMLALESGTFGATYFADSEGSHKFSLRSNGDYDVSKLAKEFGGGGHKNAAGFVLENAIDNAAGSGVTLWGIGSGADDEK